jgi:hypothetical protein
MMPQLCGVDLAIRIKESTLFRASNVGCLGRHRRAGKRTPRIKDKRRHVDQSAEIYAYARARPTGANSYCGGWRRIIGHKSTVSSCRSQPRGRKWPSYNSLLNAVWDNCAHCLFDSSSPKVRKSPASLTYIGPPVQPGLNPTLLSQAAK